MTRPLVPHQDGFGVPLRAGSGPSVLAEADPGRSRQRRQHRRRTQGDDHRRSASFASPASRRLLDRVGSAGRPRGACALVNARPCR